MQSGNFIQPSHQQQVDFNTRQAYNNWLIDQQNNMYQQQ